MYDFDIKQIGFFGGLPTICGVIVIPIYSCLADYLRTKIFSVSKVGNLHNYYQFKQWSNGP